MRDDIAAQGSDRARWGRRDSYKPGWGGRSEVAAALTPDGARVLEIGVGLGVFRSLVEGRCAYLGADLAPLDARTLPLDLETDAPPPGPFDVVVLLGVVEYLTRPEAALAKLTRAAPRAIVSYCCLRADVDIGAASPARAARRWLNHFDQKAFEATLERANWRLQRRVPFERTADFEQLLFVCDRLS